jgi:CRISPR system Cascade subunit CasA
MKFNLIDERWIPVRRRDGSPDRIAPHEVTKGFADNPVVALDAPRADFNGALIQFLIGLVQTVAASASASEWRKKLTDPPAPNELKSAFATVRDAFELAGAGPRFMQDFEDIAAEYGGIDGLLIESPGEHAKNLNTDHFSKRNSVGAMCPCCCATALFAFQTNSPAGGPGFMTSLRGGGPLTTLVIGDSYHATLWQLIQLNVLERGKFIGICGNPDLATGRAIFPWLGETRKGRRKKGDAFFGEDTTPEIVHPATMFWAMPRRIRLNLDLSSGNCDVCGSISDKLISSYKEIPGGASYGGSWLHPLSPYYEKTTKGETNILPVHAQPGGINYRHWLGLVQQDSGEKRMPARIVHEFYDRWESGWQFRLWAFGYDMDKMKARCWYESTMPLLYVDSAIRGEFEQYAAGMVKAAAEIANNARNAVKKAWFRRPSDVKGETTFLDVSFWHNTEPAFYTALDGIRNALESKMDSMVTHQVWHKTLCEHALKLFDNYAWEGPIEDADPKRVVIARKELEFFNRGKKVKELLGLPLEQKTFGKATKKKEAKQKA